MALNKSEREIIQEAQRQLNAKIVFEKRMVRPLRGFFREMSVDFAVNYAETGTILDASLFNDELKAIIQRQYRTVVRKFPQLLLSSSITEEEQDAFGQEFAKIAAEQGRSTEEEIESLRNKVALALAGFVAARTAFNVAKISATNQRELARSLELARERLTVDGKPPPTIRRIAAAAGRIFRQRGFNRVGTISATVTQNAAEGAKEIDKTVISRELNTVTARQVGVKEPRTKEQWVTVGDNLVRGSHREATLQHKKEGIYTVQNEQLRFPGDTSLGASASNTVNCRCASVTSAV